MNPRFLLLTLTLGLAACAPSQTQTTTQGAAQTAAQSPVTQSSGSGSSGSGPSIIKTFISPPPAAPVTAPVPVSAPTPVSATAPVTAPATATASVMPTTQPPITQPPTNQPPSTPATPTTPDDAWTTLPFLADKPAASYAKPANVIDPSRRYRALMTTSKGPVIIDLNPVAAPIAVNSFVFLALNHFYDGLSFHRVIAGFVAQGGDPTGTGAGGPGYNFSTETSPFAKFDSAGVLGMARSASRDSNGSQFFITLVPTPALDGSYTVFGKVGIGQSVVNALTKTENGSAKPDTILSIIIQTQAAQK